MAYDNDMVVNKAGVLKLAADLLTMTGELASIAKKAEESVDDLSLTFKDDAFTKVDNAIKLAIEGYEKMEPSIVAGASGLVSFANTL